MLELAGRHPNVVTLQAFFEDQDFYYIVMDLCQGGELYHQLADKVGYWLYITVDLCLISYRSAVVMVHPLWSRVCWMYDSSSLFVLSEADVCLSPKGVMMPAYSIAYTSLDHCRQDISRFPLLYLLCRGGDCLALCGSSCTQILERNRRLGRMYVSVCCPL